MLLSGKVLERDQVRSYLGTGTLGGYLLSHVRDTGGTNPNPVSSEVQPWRLCIHLKRYAKDPNSIQIHKHCTKHRFESVSRFSPGGCEFRDSDAGKKKLAC